MLHIRKGGPRLHNSCKFGLIFGMNTKPDTTIPITIEDFSSRVDTASVDDP